MTINNTAIFAAEKKAMYTGIFWKIVSCFCFAGVNGLVRYLSGGSSLYITDPLPIHIIMFFQYAIGLIIMLPIILENKTIINSVLKTKHPILHVIRVTTAVFGIGFWYLGLQYIPLTQVVALSFAAPFLAIIGAIVFLHEQVNLHRLIAIILSIIGGFLIVRPDLGLKNGDYVGWLALLPVLAALIFALDKIITRKLLANGESPAGVTFLLIIATTLVCLPMSIYYGWHTPGPSHYPWLLLLGILGLCAGFAFSKAFAYAEVTILMPFALTKMVFCGIIGYFIFAELPKTLDMWLGIIIATISAIVLSYEKRKTTV